VLSLRLEALPHGARAVLRVAATAGRRAGHRLLATVTDLPEPALLDALREAVAHHVLVHDSDGYAFRHALLEEAAEIAATLRAPLLLAEVEGLARRARIALGGPGGAADDDEDDDPEVDRLELTARELTVLSLVAEGHTNREIGASLFISEKTASVHVSRILAKLGVRSRVEAATTAHRLGLSAASAPRDRGSG
jgi:DNA-binding NarL/FixJ family response regulator